MSGFDESLGSCYEFEEILTDNFYIEHRKSSFIDLLSNPIGNADENLNDLQSLSSKCELPEIKSEKNNPEVLELNLDEIFEKECTKKIKEIKVSNFIEKTQNPLVGTLTIEQRKVKIMKYLEKRKKRTWRKRIYYDCRKRVADNRLRIKGRFVTREQAISILGPEHEALKDFFNFP